MELIISILITAIIFILIDRIYSYLQKREFYSIANKLRTRIKYNSENSDTRGSVSKNISNIARDFLYEWENDYKTIRSFRRIANSKIKLLQSLIDVSEQYNGRLLSYNAESFLDNNPIKGEASVLIMEINNVDVSVLSHNQCTLLKDAFNAATKSQSEPIVSYSKARESLIDLMCYRLKIKHINLFK